MNRTFFKYLMQLEIFWKKELKELNIGETVAKTLIE